MDLINIASNKSTISVAMCLEKSFMIMKHAYDNVIAI